MTKEEILEIINKVIDEQKIAIIGTTSSKRYPNVKALRLMNREDINTFYFSTKRESLKVKQMKRRSKGSIYFYDKDKYVGIMFEGKFKVENNTKYGISELYKLDAIDPYDFCSVIFKATTVYFYMNYQTVKIDL
ncbi:MAG: pyridoxamine 5'-phosphate oxidase family protein [Bacilli bacterium]|nr:pyridoxamine 5'-phosphate oxidase family protein [Bacilli bacterium]